jgi:hypothetical protein
MISDYSSAFSITHKIANHFWTGEIIAQEKIDGSQFSCGVINGKLCARSHHKQIDLDEPGTLFFHGIEYIKKLFTENKLIDDFIYRGEYLQKPKSNTLLYSRIPKNHIILFDIDIKNQDYVNPSELNSLAEKLDLECVPSWIINTRPTEEILNKWLETESILGGTKIEGIVFKNYNFFNNIDKKTVMLKYVSTAFKELHTKTWPSGNAFMPQLVERYKTDARYRKAVQHLKESGELSFAPQDIPLLMKEVNLDIIKECKDEIKDLLFEHFWKEISKNITRDIPAWYKAYLMEVIYEDTAP